MPKKISENDEGVFYDVGKNLSGFPIIKIKAKVGECVTVKFSEVILEGKLDPTHMHKQTFSVISDGSERCANAEFTWFGFRYFEVSGNAEPISVSEVHADIKTSSTFDSSNETLNWIYKTFMHKIIITFAY